MNRGQLVNSVALKAGLDTTAASEELLLMQGWANDGVVEVLKKTRCYVTTGTIALTANVGDYRIASSFIAITDLEFASSGATDYERVSMDEILDLRRVGSTKRAFSFQGDFLRINPVPTTSDTINVLYTPLPTAMTSDANDPSNVTFGGIMTQWHRAIEYYMLWQAAEYDEKRLPETPKDYRAQFEDECSDIRKRMRQFGTRRLGPVRVGYPGSRRLAAGRNDIYPIFSD